MHFRCNLHALVGSDRGACCLEIHQWPLSIDDAVNSELILHDILRNKKLGNIFNFDASTKKHEISVGIS